MANRALLLTPAATDAADSIVGTTGADTLAGLGGNDTINGLAGDDTLDGGAGNDRLFGGDGIDTVTYATATGAVNVYLALGAAQATGGSGNDQLIYVENLIGSAFNDRLSGHSGANDLAGLDGNDYLDGGGANDTLHGGAGTDTLAGRAGNDELDGGDGLDTATYAASTGSITASLATMLVTGADGSDTLADIENVFGSAFADRLTGDAGNNILSGHHGNDTLDGGAGVDTLIGGGGDDIFVVETTGDVVAEALDGGIDLVQSYLSTMALGANVENVRLMGATNGSAIGNALDNVFFASSGSNYFVGNGGRDTVSYAHSAAAVTVTLQSSGYQQTGAGGSIAFNAIANLAGSGFGDRLSGDVNANVLDGGNGNDTLYGGIDGDDTLLGGAGNDVLEAYSGKDSLDGGAGIDTLSFARLEAGVSASLLTGTAWIGEDKNTLAGFEDLLGSSYADILAGDNLDNRIDGGAGNDNLTGLVGTDTLLGGDGDDTLEGGGGNDTLQGGLGNDTVTYVNAIAGVTVSLLTGTSSGGANVDTLSGFETLSGSFFNDTLTGDAGANQIYGDVGNDTLIGGGGNDTFNGGLGSDTASFAAYGSNAVDIDLYAGWGYVIDGNDHFNVGVENLVGTLGNDRMKGSIFANRLDGGAGDDRLVAFGDGDWLIGGAGNDLLFGGGDATLDGGAGVDTISYVDATGGLTLSLAVTGPQATGGSGTDTLVSIEHLYGSWYDDAITGSANDDTLDGIGGNDWVDGGAGNDELWGGSDNDTLVGGSGDDTLVGSVDPQAVENDTASYADAAAPVTVSLALVNPQNTGGAGTDTLFSIENLIGSAFADVLTGAGTNNLPSGITSANRLDGGNGNDTLAGEGGVDTLVGGLGADHFRFTSANGQSTIEDFSGQQLDVIDLSALDANTTLAGDQAFTFIGAAAFSADATAQLRYENGVLYGSVDADAAAEFMVALTGAPPLVASDLLL